MLRIEQGSQARGHQTLCLSDWAECPTSAANEALCIVTTGRGIYYNAIIDCIGGNTMASITIRNLDERTKDRLRVRAALAQKPGRSLNLAEAIRRRLAPLGGVDLGIPVRESMREPPKFGQ